MGDTIFTILTDKRVRTQPTEVVADERFEAGMPWWDVAIASAA